MVISNAVICDIHGERKADIRIQNGVITEIGALLDGDEVTNANGAYFIPSLVDTNVRLLDGALNAQNMKAISKQALKGG